jgi:hypothetical protein
VWRHGHRLRLEEPEGQVNLIVGDDHIWQYDAQRRLHVQMSRRTVHYAVSGTQLLERRPLSEYAGNDFTQPAGEVTTSTFLGRPAWTVELAPPAHKPHPVQLVVDAQTGIVLQQRNDGPGTTDEWVEFVVDQGVDPSLFTWAGPVVTAGELQAVQQAGQAADLERRSEWFRSTVTSAPLRLEFDVPPLVHVHAEDGSFEASLGLDAGFGSLARRPRSDEPCELHGHSFDHRWSTPRWDWALSFLRASPTEASVQALMTMLSERDQ